MKYFLTIILVVTSNYLLASTELLYPYKLNLIEYKATILSKLQKGSLLKGKKIIADRKVNCLSCHQAPIPEERFQGNFGPSLEGIGSRYTKEEIRFRVINSKLLNPNSIMPSYFVKIKNPRTPSNFLGKTILNVKEVEDIVEYLYSLK